LLSIDSIRVRVGVVVDDDDDDDDTIINDDAEGGSDDGNVDAVGDFAILARPQIIYSK
jgi:hypothetical protein